MQFASGIYKALGQSKAWSRDKILQVIVCQDFLSTISKQPCLITLDNLPGYFMSWRVRLKPLYLQLIMGALVILPLLALGVSAFFSFTRPDKA